MSIKSDSNLSLFKKKIKERLGDNLLKIIFFGSRARKDAGKYSDYDFIVILKKCNSKIKDQILEIEGEMLYDKNAVFSTFPFSQDEFSLKRYEPFIINATKEGVAL